MVYHFIYPGAYEMQAHDSRGALRRWFDDYKNRSHASFADDYEWVVVHPEPAPKGRRKGRRVFCEIGDDRTGKTRRVEIDATAPDPPVLRMAALRKYVPPPPKDIEDMMREREWNRRLKDSFSIYEYQQDWRGYIAREHPTIDIMDRDPRPFRMEIMYGIDMARGRDRTIMVMDSPTGRSIVDGPELQVIKPPKQYRRNT